MTTYSKETPIYNTDAIESGINDAAGTASNFIVADPTGLHVHTSGNTSEEILIEGSALSAYNSAGTEYFRVTADGLSYGANTAATSDDLASMATVFEATTETVTAQVSNVIDGLKTSSLFQETANGFTFSLDTEIANIYGDLETINEYVNISGDTMRLGSKTKPVVAELSSDGLSFYRVDTATEQIDYQHPIASLMVEGSGDEAQGVLVIHRAVVVNELRFDDWVWMPRGNGNLSLKWIGGE